MIHIVFFLLILSLAIGTSAVIQLAILNRQAKQSVLTWYIAAQVFLGLAIFADLLTIYLSLFLPENAAMPITGIAIYHLSLAGIASALPLMTDGLLLLSKKRNHLILVGSFGFLFPAAIAIHLLAGVEFLTYIGESLVLAIGVWTIMRLYPRQKNTTESAPPLRRISTLVMLLLAVFLPMFVLEMLFRRAILSSGNIILDTSVLMLGLYLIWNSINLGYIVNQFRIAYPPGSLFLKDTLMEQCGLSKREKTLQF